MGSRRSDRDVAGFLVDQDADGHLAQAESRTRLPSPAAVSRREPELMAPRGPVECPESRRRRAPCTPRNPEILPDYRDFREKSLVVLAITPAVIASDAGALSKLQRGSPAGSPTRRARPRRATTCSTARRSARGEHAFACRVWSVCMEKLRFRFEDEQGAVILDGWAHRAGCPRPPASLPARARLVAAGGVVLSDRCPHECDTCAPRFLTLLSHQTGS
jgi:hypothetical protein